METTHIRRAILIPIAFLLIALIYKIIVESLTPAPPPVRATYDCAAKDLHAEFYHECVRIVGQLEFFDNPEPVAQKFEQLSFTNQPKGSGCQIETHSQMTGKYRTDNQEGTHKFRCVGTYKGDTDPLIETWLVYEK